MICPYAKDIGYEHIKGCTNTPKEQGIDSGNTAYLRPCTESCYNGDYLKCPLYMEPEEPEK